MKQTKIYKKGFYVCTLFLRSLIKKSKVGIRTRVSSAPEGYGSAQSASPHVNLGMLTITPPWALLDGGANCISEESILHHLVIKVCLSKQLVWKARAVAAGRRVLVRKC